MKKYFLLTIIILMAVLVIFSCRKSFDSIPDQTTPIMENLTEQKIVDFLARFDTPLKEEEMYTIEEVLWYSTAGLNYTYAIYDSAYVYDYCDTSYFSMDIDGNELVAETDLQAAYDKMADTLSARYDALQDNIKHLIYCAVYQDRVYNGELYVGMIFVFGGGYTGSFYGSFGQIDYWYAVMDYGKCDQYAPAFYGVKDAGDEIAYKINFPNTDNIPNYRVYSIPASDYIIEVDPQDYQYVGSPSGFRAYYYLGNGNWPGPQCLSPAHLNFYLSSNGIYYILVDNEPYGYDFTWISIQGDLLPIYPWYEEVHWMTITYGEINATQVPAEEL